MVIPLVSSVLILRVWRKLDYALDGSWWGAVILVATVTTVHLREQSILVLGPAWNIYMPPLSLVAFAYTAGVVLLFGGPRLFHAALFPIALMWFVNPIPILICAETIETSILPDIARQQMTAAIRDFAASVNLNSLTQPYPS